MEKHDRGKGRLVGISANNHKQLKVLAALEGKTMTILSNEILTEALPKKLQKMIDGNKPEYNIGPEDEELSQL